MKTDGQLTGLGVAVTRPAEQSAALTALLEQAGARVLVFPAIEILPPTDTAGLQEFARRPADYDVVIFVSANAVRGIEPWWPDNKQDGLYIAAIGQATAKQLASCAITVDIVPTGRFDSEGLLQQFDRQGWSVNGQQVAIVRGDGGREHLARELRGRGATVRYIEAYQRVKPSSDPRPLLDGLASGDINIIVVTSQQGLQNLLEMAAAVDRTLLLDSQLVVASGRIAKFARQSGFKKPAVVADQASDDALYAAIVDHYSRG